MIKSYRPWYIDIAGLLVAESAFHVGTGESLNPDTDSPAARRDGAARNGLILPGSSLKGVLRSFMNRECGTVGCTREDVQRLFGSASGKSGSQGWLTILDAVATELSPSSEKRDHVRIDRRYGAAADGAKFDEEAGVNGTTFDFRAIYEGENDAKCFRLMNLAFEALTRSELRVGAGQSRGFGKVRLEALPSCRVFRRDTVEGLQTFVAYRVEQDTASETVVWPSGLGLGDASPLSCPSALSTLSVNLAIHCEGPVLVRAAPREHEQTDAEFFASAGKKVLPGSSLRGVCRSRAEKICNTLEIGRAH